MSQKPPYYKTSAGACPLEKFLDDLSDADAAVVNAAMKEVQEEGTRVAHFIRNEISERNLRSKGSRQRSHLSYPLLTGGKA